MAKKRNGPAKEAASKNVRANPITFAASSATQCKVLLAALRKAGNRGLTTVYGRHRLGIIHPGGRIYDLRQAGAEIVTRWDRDTTPDGIAHRVARYVLVSAGGAA